MAYKAGAKGQSRDLGLDGHSAGKGSAPRNNASAEFRLNHDLIVWPGLGDSRVRRVGHKLIKTYK